MGPCKYAEGSDPQKCERVTRFAHTLHAWHRGRLSFRKGMALRPAASCVNSEQHPMTSDPQYVRWERSDPTGAHHVIASFRFVKICEVCGRCVLCMLPKQPESSPVRAQHRT